MSNRKPLTQEDVVAFVGQMGLAQMQADLTDPNEWPTADATFDSLSNSSRWACIRRGMEFITEMCGTPKQTAEGGEADPFPNLHKSHWIREDDHDTDY